MNRQVLMLLSCGLLIVAASPSWARKWADKTGKYSVQAELVEVRGANVILKKSDGAVISVPVARLSEADRAFVKRAAGAPGAAAKEPPSAAVTEQQPGRNKGSVFASWESSGELAIGRKRIVFKDLPKPRLVIGS